MAIRNVYIDSVLSSVGGSAAPRYDPATFNIAGAFDLRNEITRAETPRNAGQITNFLDGSNLLSFSDTEFTTSGFLTDDFTLTATEKTADPATGIKRVVFKHTCAKRADGRWLAVDMAYDVNEFGVNVVVLERRAYYTRSAGGWGAVVS